MENHSNITEEEQSILDRAFVITQKLQKNFDDNKRDLHYKYMNELNDKINRYEREVDQMEETVKLHEENLFKIAKANTIKFRENLRTHLSDKIRTIVAQKERIGVYTGNCIHGKLGDCIKTDPSSLTCGVCQIRVTRKDLDRSRGKII